MRETRAYAGDAIDAGVCGRRGRPDDADRLRSGVGCLASSPRGRDVRLTTWDVHPGSARRPRNLRPPRLARVAAAPTYSRSRSRHLAPSSNRLWAPSRSLMEEMVRRTVRNDIPVRRLTPASL